MVGHFCEIDEGAGYIGYREALEHILSNTKLLGSEEILLGRSSNRIAAKDTIALISHPACDVSLKDGFSVKSTDVEEASVQRPATLKIVGSAFAATAFNGKVRGGSTVKVCSGAAIPAGADAVVAGEFCEEISKEEVIVRADAGAGRNVLEAGGEIRAGMVIVKKGSFFSPGNIGLAATAGISRVSVYRRAKVGIVGVGDEVVLPGERIHPGQVYASNLMTVQAWLSSFGIKCVASVVRDNVDDIKLELTKGLFEADVIMTSGGAWGSLRDLVIEALDDLGWQKVLHRVRMGPGKGIAFGILADKPIFCLPGGPASNAMAFLQLALPGILHMSGDRRPPLQSVPAKLTENLKGRNRAWTEFKDAVLSRDPVGAYTVSPCRIRSSLQSIAGANSLICIPEGRESLTRDEVIPIQALISRIDMI
jgi:molybdopterin molybdotransferase